MSKSVRFLFAGFYAWISAVFFGAVIMDIVSARNLEKILGGADKTSFFSEISDFLLLIAFILVIAALIAIALAWQSAIARNLFIASLLIFLVEFWLPIVFSILKISTQLSWLRFFIDGMGSVLAWVGLQRFYRSK
jgi:hypothetical protein